MKAFINGRIVPQEQAVVSVLDRAFLYGDGLFETMRFYKGHPFRWEAHMQRLSAGAKFLGLTLPICPDELLAFAKKLVMENRMPNAIVRVTTSRGIGPRGYSAKGANAPTTCMTVHPATETSHATPPPWRLIISTFRLPAGDRLAHYKTCNKLSQIMARSEADAAGADEALLLNTDGYVVEAASSNLFWLDENLVCTAPLGTGILPGVTRAVVYEIAGSLGLSVRETHIRASELAAQDGVFLSASTVGIALGESVDAAKLKHNGLIMELGKAYAALVERETS